MLGAKAFLQRLQDSDILERLVFLLSFFSLACAGYYTFHKPARLDAYSFFFLGLMCLLGLASAYSILSKNTLEQKPKGIPFLHAQIIFATALLLACYRLDYFSVRLDEDLQTNVLLARYENIVQGAAFTQMPLSYFFAALNLDLFGFTELGIRFFPCVFFAGSAVLFANFFYLLESRVFIRFLAATLFITNPWLVRYAQEGRPYSCAVFFALLWSSIVFSRILLVKAPSFKKDGLLFFTATALLLLSIAFQSLVLSLSVFLGIIPLLIAHKHWKHISVLGVALAAAALSVSPLIYLSIAKSTGFLHPSPHFDALTQPNLIFLRSLYNLFRYQSALVLLAACFGFFIFFARRKKLGEQSLPIKTLIAASFSSAFFALVFSALFVLLIDYQLFVRYYLCVLPIGLLAGMILLEQAYSYIRSWAGGSAMSVVFVFVLAVIFLTDNAIGLYQAFTTDAFNRYGHDEKKQIQILQEEGVPGDIAYTVPMQSPYLWEQRGFVSAKFYIGENFPVRLVHEFDQSQDQTLIGQILGDLRAPVPKHVFIVFVGRELLENPTLEELGNKQAQAVYSGHGFLMFKLLVEDGLSATLTRFFESLVSNRPTKQFFRIFDILMSLSEYEKKPEKCFSYLKALEQIGSHTPKIVQLLEEHARRCQALR